MVRDSGGVPGGAGRAEYPDRHARDHEDAHAAGGEQEGPGPPGPGRRRVPGPGVAGPGAAALAVPVPGVPGRGAAALAVRVLSGCVRGGTARGPA